MGGGSKSQVVGYKYYAGMHMVICHGPIDLIRQMEIDRKVAWTGENTGQSVSIDSPGLFGGESREGGIIGTIDVEFGEDTQGQNSYLQSILGSDIPAFRGVVGFVLRQLYWGVNPYLKKWSFRGQRVNTRQNGITQWYPEKAPIPASFGVYDNLFFDLACEPYTEGAWSCSCPSIDQDSMQVSSNLPVSTFRVRVRGVIERYNYSGGTEINQYVYKDATNYGGSGINFYYIQVSNPSAKYYINNGSFNQYVEAVDFTIDLPVYPGATVTLVGNSADEGSVNNQYDVTVVDDDPINPIEVSQPYDGQFMQCDITLLGDQIDLNPAHIIRECLTDPIWGMGYPESEADDTSFGDSADTLYKELMGISLLWDKQMPLKNFVTEIIRHIDAALYVSRTTGKFILKLIRADYDVETLITLDPSNSKKVTNFVRPTVGDLINSVTVNFWDYKTGNDSSVTVQDPALIQMQGAVINTTIQYPGFTNMATGSRAATRDLKTLSTPLITGQIETGIIAKDFNIGNVFKLTWPDYDVDSVVVRITKISFGDGVKNAIKINFVQDKFDYTQATPITENEDEWEEPGGPPVPVDNQITEEATYFELVQFIGEDEVESILTATPTAGYLVASAPRPLNGIQARLWIDNGAGYEDINPMEFCPSATLSEDAWYSDSVLNIEDLQDLDIVTVGTYGQIGDELVRFDSYDSVAGTVTIGRGVLDTLPDTHSTGDKILFWDVYAVSDLEEYQTPEIISAKITPTTSEGTMDVTEASAVSIQMNSRAIRPFPPGNIQINNLSFPETLYQVSTYTTWVGRDRLQQTGPIIDFFDSNIGPEANTTYDIEIYDEDSSLATSLLTTILTEFFYSIEDEISDLSKTVLAGDGIFTTVTPDASDLEASYPSSGLSGSSLPDDSGNNHDAIATNITVAPGDTGLIFNGSITSHVEIPNAVMNGAGEYAISMWINLEDQITESALISLANSSEFEELYFAVNDQFYLKEEGTISWENQGPIVVPLKAKMHVVLVREA